MNLHNPFFKIEKLSVVYQKSGFELAPLSFSLSQGEILGIAGESGSGKSTLAKALVGLEPLKTGEIFIEGAPLNRKEKKNLRKIQLVFQDPYSAFNPILPLFQSLFEPLEIHFKLDKNEKINRVLQWTHKVGLKDDVLEKKPKELSGGQLQRLSIARALLAEPQLLILDEPLSSLDVPLQIEIMGLLKSLSQSRVTQLLISHDLSALRFLSDATLILQQGKLVEMDRTPELFKNPKHSYTKKLIDSILLPDPEKERKKLK